jgi:transcriptional regulator with XRE-family HTH domain
MKVSCRVPGARLRELREARVLTQHEVAQELVRLAWVRDGIHVGVNADMVSKWERDEKHPSRVYLELLGLLYDVDLRSSEIARSDTRSREHQDTDEAAFLASLTDAADLLHQLGQTGNLLRGRMFEAWKDEFVKRRTFLKLASIGPTTLAFRPGTDPRATPSIRVSTETLDGLDTLAGRYRTLYHSTSPAALMSAAIAHLGASAEVLRPGVSARARHRLLRNRSEVATLAGRIAFFDLKDPLAARAYYHSAAESAREADDRLMAATALVHTAFIAASDGHFAAAGDYLNGARTLVGRSHASTMKSWISAVEAEILVQSGDTDRALASIARAEYDLADGADTAGPAWFDYYDAARLDGFKGYTLLAAGSTNDARLILRAALRNLPNQAVKQRSVFLADLATTNLRDGELEEACRLASKAAETLRQAGYATGTGRLRDFRALVEPWKHHPAVRTMDAQLAAS